jgi:ABC-2 type transport system permease protein
MTTGVARMQQVWGALLRASLARGMQYRADFFFDSATAVLRNGARVVPILLVMEHREAVLGWSTNDLLLVMGLYLLLQAVVAGIIEPNLGSVVDQVRTGGFDLMLLKPVDAQAYVSLNTVDPGKLWDLLAAVVVIGWALSRGQAPAAIDAVVAIVMLAAGVVAIYGLWLMAVSLAFRFVRVDNIRFLLQATLDAGRWPVDMFTGWVRWLFTIGIPVAVFTTFPALALRGQWDTTLLATGVGVGLLFGFGSRAAWKASLARYTSASS